MYEHKSEGLLSLHAFAWRLTKHVLLALLVILGILIIGILGNMLFEHISLHDAILNIALTVSGIGPFVLPETSAGKLFFAIFSIFVGIVFMASIGMILAPVAHRILHKFHLDELMQSDDDDD